MEPDLTEPPDTAPDHERPTDPSPPCQHTETEHLFDSTYFCFLCTERVQGPALDDLGMPTDPSPPPDACLCPICELPCIELDGLYGCCAECAMRESLAEPLKNSQAPTPLDSGAMALAPTVSSRAAEESAPKLRGAGHWLDYGKDTGPRLRVRGLVDEKELFPLVDAEPTHDPKAIDELHAASVRAFREEDDHALGKIYEDLLDDIHSSDAGDGAMMAELARAAGELRAAITAELREVARSEKNWGWKHTLSEHGIRIRARTPQGDFLECQIDRRGTQALIRQAFDDPRGAASSCVREAREQIHNARARIMVGGFVPVVNEVGQA